MIPFNKPHLTGNELNYILQAHSDGRLAGNGIFTKKCNSWIEDRTQSKKALITHSCTAALEMAAVLCNIERGDEVILPSYTFVSTANAFVLRGATPVFVDIRKDTLNMDESLIEQAITPKTKAVIPVHYAGNSCEMDSINLIAKNNSLVVVEDAAQAVMSTYKGKYLGGIGQLGAYSFHETKNIISGEGGALIVNDEKLAERAEIIWEKGTNRNQFFRGEIDKYSWVDVGSSYLPGELTAAFLYAQLEDAKSITQSRLKIWDSYHSAFKIIEDRCGIRRPIISKECSHNAHMYYLLMKDPEQRIKFIDRMKLSGIQAVFHYVPLHNSKYGNKIGRCSGELNVTIDVADRIVRIPLWIGIDYERVINSVLDFAFSTK